MNKHHEKGFSLIEMLIALAVFSLALLALSEQQFKNTQAISNAYFEQVAEHLIHNAYEQSEIQDPHANTILQNAAATLLPQGSGEVVSDAQHIYIAVSWVNRFSDTPNHWTIDI